MFQSFYTTIVTLCLTVCPTDISYFVMTVIVNSVQRIMGCWLNAYMVNKLLIRLKSKFNPASAIITISGIGRGLTSCFGVLIRAIFSCLCIPFAACSVRDAIAEGFSIPTSARFCPSINQLIPTSFSNRATFTFTKPTAIMSAFACITQNGQTVKFLPRQISKFRTFGMFNKNYVIFSIGHCEKVTPFSYVIRAVRSLRFFQPVFIIS